MCVTGLLTLAGASCSVGMLFLPNDDKLEEQAIQIIKDVVKREGRCKIVGWRDVPVDPSVVGRFAKVTQPRIKQVGVAWRSAFCKHCGCEPCCIVNVIQRNFFMHAA